MSASASKGGIRLLAVCAAINLTLAAAGWCWQGRFVSGVLLDKIARGGGLTLGSWNWNAIHVILWALWLSGWFAFLSARVRSDRAGGPDLHKIAMTLAAAAGAASLMWLWALWDVGWKLAELDAGGLPSKSAIAGLLGWAGLPLAIGAGAAFGVAFVLLRWRFPEPALTAEEEASRRAGDVSPPRALESGRDRKKEKPKGPPQRALHTLQFGLTILSLAGFGLFWQFVAFGPAETTWSLDRLFTGPAAEGWAALCFLVLAHVAHLASGALTVFDRGEPQPAVEADKANDEDDSPVGQASPDREERMDEASTGVRANATLSEPDAEAKQPSGDA